MVWHGGETECSMNLEEEVVAPFLMLDFVKHNLVNHSGIKHI